MLFSIVVPVFNARSSLSDCLDSILAQKINDFEVITIDDGSTDGSGNILESYAIKDPRIRVFHYENAGVSCARKRGISHARGDYIVFVDCDDTINSNLLFELVAAMQIYNSPTLIRYQVNLIGDPCDNDHERCNCTNSIHTVLDGISALKLWSQPKKEYAFFWLFAFKRKLFTKIPFEIDLRCYEDVALIPLLIAASNTVATIDYVGYNYTCDNTTSLTHTRSEAAERSRALDYFDAYNYAVKIFAKLNNVSSLDIDFFVNDYTLRLEEKFNSLPDNLKYELAEHFKT